MKPTFSIVVPTLNEEKYIPRLLSSLSEQTERDFEVIIVDGRSKDRTVDIAKKFIDRLPCLRIIVSDRRGVSVQRNIGSREAKGEWIITTDADTIYRPYCLYAIKEYIKTNSTFHFTSWFIPEKNDPSDALLILLINASMELTLKMKAPSAYGAFMVTKKILFESLGGFDESLEFGEDNDLCRRAYEFTGQLMGMIREGLVTYSLRRFHHYGILHTLRLYAHVSFIFFLTKRTPRRLPGYSMGGHIYVKKKKKEWKATLKSYEKTIKKLIRDLMKLQ